MPRKLKDVNQESRIGADEVAEGGFEALRLLIVPDTLGRDGMESE